MEKERKRIAVVGAGFAGLWAVRVLARSGAEVTLIDRNNYHTFLPLIYQVGAAEIEPEQIGYPVRMLLRRYRNVRFVKGSVTGLDLAEKHLSCHGKRIDFDYCIVAPGSVSNFYGIPGAEDTAFTLKTLDDAVILRNHILSCFERASDTADARDRLLRFIIVGGGPTGVEFAGALLELIKVPLRRDFPELGKERVNVLLIETSDRLLGALPPELGEYAMSRLQKFGVDVRLNAKVVKLTEEGLGTDDGNFYSSETVIWTAGIRGPDFTITGAERTGDGRIKVLPTLQVPAHECAYVAGDLALVLENGRPLPAVAPTAIQEGRFAAENIVRQMKGEPLREFRYADKGSMATIGRNAGVVRIGRKKFKGYPAWVIWLVVHILYLIGFRNKLLVMISWAWNYIFFEKAIRLIMPACCENPSRAGCRRRGCSG